MAKTLKPSEPPQPLLERAFDLAREGKYSNVQALEAVLRREGYVRPEMVLYGRSLRKQLRELLGKVVVSSE